jgi:hypothetical protein
MARRNPPRKVTYFEPIPPRLARNTIIESTFEVGRRFRCTMRVDCGQLEPGAVIRPVPGEWHPRMPERLDEEELAENFPFQRASLSLVDKGLVLIYLQRDPRFEDANLRALSGRTCPRLDQAFLHG